MLLLVLAVALPAQGVMAATMAMCGSHTGDGGVITGAATHEHAEATLTHDHVDVFQHTHAKSLGSAESHAAGHADDGHHDADSGAPTKHGFHKCSVCASCCVGAAVPSTAFLFEPVALTDSIATLGFRSFAAVVPKGLERPPRPLLG